MKHLLPSVPAVRMLVEATMSSKRATRDVFAAIFVGFLSLVNVWFAARQAKFEFMQRQQNEFICACATHVL